MGKEVKLFLFKNYMILYRSQKLYKKLIEMINKFSKEAKYENTKISSFSRHQSKVV